MDRGDGVFDPFFKSSIDTSWEKEKMYDKDSDDIQYKSHYN